MYADQLERWFAALPREQMLVIESGALFANPGATVSRVLAFLGLPDRRQDTYPVAQNAIRHGGVPAEPAASLRERFREPNERLFALLGERYTWNDE